MSVGSRFVSLFSIALAVSVPTAKVQAQQGTITGQVTDAETGAALSGASVEALGEGGPVGSNDAGRFILSVAPGSHSIVVTLIGYETTRVDGVSVDAGATANVTISLRSQALVLNPIVVTASRRQEKALDAPASIATVSANEIARIAATTAADHVRTLPGVDAVRTGINQGTVVARGFNNVFSGALLTIIDNRYARIPSLRFNAYQMLPATDLDIDRIEVSLGPGAALYGPNASNGVMHIITKSPIDEQGSSISLAGGERSIFHGQFRTSVSPSDRFGMKISGQYFRGNDWEYADPQEIVARDYFADRYSADARFDVRFADDGEFIANAGTSTVLNGIEMTGIGSAQVRNWGYNFAQARFLKGRLFAQAFLNQTNSGSDAASAGGDGSFFLRTGSGVVDQSRTMALQFQYGFDLGSWQSFTYGVDWQRTEPRTGGTIFGRNEDNDDISEVGAYLHSETSLGDKVELVTAIRIDDHNRLADANISPRAALVIKPAENHNIRFTYNRAFATPSTTNLFLDILAGQIPLPGGLSYGIRALGVPSGGFTFGAQCPGGIMNYCMRSPLTQGAIPANAALFWDSVLGFLPLVDPRLALLVDFLKSPGALPGDPVLGTVLRRLDQAAAGSGGNPFPVDLSPVDDISELTSTIHNTIEAGYKGLMGNRVLLSTDVYFTRIENFVGPLRIITPNVFFEPASVQAFVLHRISPLIQAGILSAEDAAVIVQTLAAAPLGTIVPDQVGSPDLLVTFRNFGEVDFWGADLAAQFLVSDRVRLQGSYSFHSDECFDLNEDGNCTSSDDIALNAPNHKGSFALTFDDQAAGFSFQGRVRMTGGFPMNSGVYIGDVDAYKVLDASIGYSLPFQPSTRISLTANNVLNNVHSEFFGAPEIGRLLLARVQYDF